MAAISKSRTHCRREDKAGFQARGRVIYSDPNSGSGVEFQGVEPRYQAILEEWLLEAKGMDEIDKAG